MEVTITILTSIFPGIYTIEKARRLLSMDQTVVVYFDPYHGTVSKIAQNVAKALNCDVIEVLPESEYSKSDLQLLNPFSRINKEIHNKIDSLPIKINHDFSNYDFVCFCFPMWNHTVPKVASHFAHLHNFPTKHQRLWCFGVQPGFMKRSNPTVSFVITDTDNYLWFHDTVKGFHKIEEAVRQQDPLSTYKMVRGLKYIGSYNETDYPSEMPEGSMCNGAIYSGHAFKCFTRNGIEYIMITTKERTLNYISAYDWNQPETKRIGAAYYYPVQSNGDFYLKIFVVAKNYRNQGIGGNILKAMILAEQNQIAAGNNLFVHASTSIERYENQLTQAELESLYQKYGFTLVSNEDDVYFELVKVTPEARAITEKWLRDINIVSSK